MGARPDTARGALLKVAARKPSVAAKLLVLRPIEFTSRFSELRDPEPTSGPVIQLPSSLCQNRELWTARGGSKF